MKRGHVLLLLVCGTLLLWGVAAYLAIDPRPPTREVVLTEWHAITDQDRRLRVAKELHERGHLIGMTPDQVVAELGKPNNRNLPGYGDIKYIVAPSMVDDLWLCIYVEGGKVVSTAIQSDWSELGIAVGRNLRTQSPVGSMTAEAALGALSATLLQHRDQGHLTVQSDTAPKFLKYNNGKENRIVW